MVEVVSPDDPGRDLVEKRADYAEAGIAEYWIADPRDQTIRVLTLQDGAYVEHGCTSAVARRHHRCWPASLST